VWTASMTTKSSCMRTLTLMRGPAMTTQTALVGRSHGSLPTEIQRTSVCSAGLWMKVFFE
jgi:hypothetical protein